MPARRDTQFYKCTRRVPPPPGTAPRAGTGSPSAKAPGSNGQWAQGSHSRVTAGLS